MSYKSVHIFSSLKELDATMILMHYPIKIASVHLTIWYNHDLVISDIPHCA